MTGRGLFLFKAATDFCRGGNILAASKLPALRQENDNILIQHICEKAWITLTIKAQCLVCITFFDHTRRMKNSRVHGIEVAHFERGSMDSKTNFCM